MRRLAAALLLAAGPAGAGDLAVVTSQTAQAVSIVDLASGAVRVTVPVAAALSPPERESFAAAFTSALAQARAGHRYDHAG